MDIEDSADTELIARLRRLDADASPAAPGFDYDGMLVRQSARVERARRRQRIARGSASMLVVALVGVSAWRLQDHGPVPARAAESAPRESTAAAQPRIVRADTYLALAALEDHIASVDDALSVARAYAPRGAEVTRLERTRAELLDSYAQVRYAELVSANY